MIIEMKVKFVTLDPSSRKFLVLLMDLENKSALPIWVGQFEAIAIALKLEKAPLHRPLTHDLIRNVIQSLNCHINRVVVNDLRENTYYALIYIKAEKGEVVIDSRPSDAITLALGSGAPIFVEEDVLNRAKHPDLSDRLSEWLENLKPEDFKNKA
jgi:bifunctional DNase/RNase